MPAELRPTILPSGRQVTAIYLRRQLLATLSFSAKNNATAAELCELLEQLFEESENE